MNGFKIRVAGMVLLGGSLLGVGCKKSASPAPTVPVQNADGTISNPNGSVTVPAGSAPAQAQGAPQQMAIRNPDGSITNPDGSVTYPAGSRVAERENNPNGNGASPVTSQAAPVAQAAPITRSAAPVVESPSPVRLTVPAGTPVTVRLNGGLSASRNEVGDHWSGVLERPLVYRGTTIFASGTSVGGEVVAAKGRGRFKGAGDLGIELTAIGRERVESSEYEKVAKGRGKRTAGFIGGGGGLGALIGGLAGGGKGALIGGLAGAGAGTAAGAYTGSRDVVIPSESVITFRLRSSVTR